MTISEAVAGPRLPFATAHLCCECQEKTGDLAAFSHASIGACVRCPCGKLIPTSKEQASTPTPLISCAALRGFRWARQLSAGVSLSKFADGVDHAHSSF